MTSFCVGASVINFRAVDHAKIGANRGFVVSDSGVEIPQKDKRTVKDVASAIPKVR